MRCVVCLATIYICELLEGFHDGVHCVCLDKLVVLLLDSLVLYLLFLLSCAFRSLLAGLALVVLITSTSPLSFLLLPSVDLVLFML